jgi:hypothetical protein
MSRNINSCGRTIIDDKRGIDPCTSNETENWESHLETVYYGYQSILKYERDVQINDGFKFDDCIQNNKIVYNKCQLGKNPKRLKKEDFINILKSSKGNYIDLTAYIENIRNYNKYIDVKFSRLLKSSKRPYDKSIDDGEGGKIYTWEFTTSSSKTTGGSSTIIPISIGDYTFYSSRKSSETTTNYINTTYFSVYADKDTYVTKISVYNN